MARVRTIGRTALNTRHRTEFRGVRKRWDDRWRDNVGRRARRGAAPRKREPRKREHFIPARVGLS